MAVLLCACVVEEHADKSVSRETAGLGPSLQNCGGVGWARKVGEREYTEMKGFYGQIAE